MLRGRGGRASRAPASGARASGAASQPHPGSPRHISTQTSPRPARAAARRPGLLAMLSLPTGSSAPGLPGAGPRPALPARHPPWERLRVKGGTRRADRSDEGAQGGFASAWAERSDPLTLRPTVVPGWEPTARSEAEGPKSAPTKSAPLQPPAITSRFHGPNHPGGIASPDHSQQDQAVPSLTRGTSAPRPARRVSQRGCGTVLQVHGGWSPATGVYPGTSRAEGPGFRGNCPARCYPRNQHSKQVRP